MGFFRDTIEESRLKCELDNLRLQCQVYLDELIRATNELKKPKTYEYLHIANNQFSKLKDSIVELMNQGWEPYGDIQKELASGGPGMCNEYSQIMRRGK